MKLRTHRKYGRELLFTQGKVYILRYVLRPIDQESKNNLITLNHRNVVIPLDEFLGIDNLPFKISIQMILDIAYWAVTFKSYQATEDYYLRSK